MSNIYLVRHGQASFNADDYDQLSALGVKQATLLSQAFEHKGLSPDIVIRGSMLRHQQTAQHSLTQFSDITIDVDSRWNEYDHQNILGVYNPAFATPQGIRQSLANEPQPMKAFKHHFVSAMDQWMSSDNSAYSESWHEFNQRIEQALSDVALKHYGKDVIIFSSGGPISLIACSLLGMNLQQFMTINWSLVNGGITKIQTRNGGKNISLSTLNEHDVFERELTQQLITYT